jgi:flagellar motor protein MotB
MNNNARTLAASIEFCGLVLALALPASRFALAQEGSAIATADAQTPGIRAEVRELKRSNGGILTLVIVEKAKGKVRIEGHTDSKGSDAYNQRLSGQRANAVRDWLVEKEGLKQVKFVTRGFGEVKPVVPNTKLDGSDDPEGRQKNRRVEIIVGK